MSITSLTAPIIRHSSDASAIGSPDVDGEGEMEVDIQTTIGGPIDQDFAHPSSSGSESDYDEEPNEQHHAQPQPRRGRGGAINGNGYSHHNHQAPSSANADPQLYGLRRSVSVGRTV